MGCAGLLVKIHNKSKKEKKAYKEGKKKRSMSKKERKKERKKLCLLQVKINVARGTKKNWKLVLQIQSFQTPFFSSFPPSHY